MCSLAEVRALRGTKDTDTSQDSLVELLIEGASEAINEWCERQFAPIETGVTKTFSWDRQGELASFAPWDLQSLTNPATSVVADTDNETPYTLTAEEYRLWPYSKRDGVYQGVRVRPFGASFGAIPWPYRQLKVTGTWGFPTVPRKVAEACMLTVAYRIRQNPGAARRTDDGVIVVNPPQVAIPLEAQQLVEHYKRVAF